MNWLKIIVKKHIPIIIVKKEDGNKVNFRKVKSLKNYIQVFLLK